MKEAAGKTVFICAALGILYITGGFSSGVLMQRYFAQAGSGTGASGGGWITNNVEEHLLPAFSYAESEWNRDRIEETARGLSTAYTAEVISDDWCDTDNAVQSDFTNYTDYAANAEYAVNTDYTAGAEYTVNTDYTVGAEYTVNTDNTVSEGYTDSVNDSDTESRVAQDGADATIPAELSDNLWEILTDVERSTSYKKEDYTSYQDLVSTFFSIDSGALADSDLLDVTKLWDRDMSITDEEGPEILIYHTHSKEAFADSEEGNESTTIVGIGDYLTELLEERYGYEVIHVRDSFDINHNQAYSVSLPCIEKVLEENPSVQVVIDLHRDASSPNRENSVEINGVRVARFMFFNGVSASKKLGEIEYLKNPNRDGNLAFSFQLEKMAMEYYPGLTRKNYIKQYRYNMHLRERCLLIELGDEKNTVEEARNACIPLAYILHQVLDGSG